MDKSIKLKVVKESLEDCGFRGYLPPVRFYVIAEPICETGICKQFETEQEAQEYIKQLKAD